MGHLPLLDELAIVAALAVLVTVMLSKLKLPTVAGLLLAGALLGPFGLGLVSSVQAIEVLAEIGVVLLLFSIGLEFSLARLRDILRQVALGGALQVGLTTGVVAGVAVLFGQAVGRGVFYGFAFALSSTAIVLRALSERRELDAPHGKFIVGTLIFQDLCVVPMVLIVPLLNGASPAGQVAISIGLALGKAAVVVVGTVLVARFVVPKILGWVDASRSREVFLLAILALCIGTAWLTAVEVIARLLRSIELPRNVIESTIQSIRAETQTSERKQTLPRAQLGDLRALSELKIESVLVREGSAAAGASPASLQLRSTTGVLVVGLRRGDELLQNPEPRAAFAPGDIVYVVGTSAAIRTALSLFDDARAAG